MMKSNCESEYDFTLLLNGVDAITTELEEALFTAGCDDATISLQYGRVSLTFSRTAESLLAAIISAIQNIRHSGIDATVLRVDDCDLVTQAEIARRIDRTRQLVNQYIQGTRGAGGFPSPACNITDGVPLWYWCEVAFWLCENSLIKENDLRNAQDIAIINNVLEREYQQLISPKRIKKITEALCK